MDPKTKAKLRLAYDADAERRNSRNPEAWRFDAVDALVARMLDEGRETVLDAGCGTGQMAERMAHGGLAVTGIDLSPANVICTRARGVTAIVADFDDLPFGDGAFHGALAFNSLHHVPKAALGDVLVEIRRVLVPGAFLQIVVWGGFDHEGPHDSDWLDPPRFFSFFTDAAFHNLETPGFHTIETKLLHEYEEADELHPQLKLLQAE